MTELTIDQALQQGVEAHKAGQVQEADRLYTAILKAQPKHPDANHNMGVLAVGVGKVQEALPFFKTALEANPATAQFWFSYIDALIKLDKLAEAKAVLDQAKSSGAKGDGFDQLEQRLQETGQEPLEATRITAEVPLQQPNILDSLKLDQALKLAKKKVKEGSPEEAKRIYQDVLVKFPKNKRASDGLKGLTGKTVGKASKVQGPPQNQTQSVINLYNQGQLATVVEQAQALTEQYPDAFIVWNLLGAAAAQIGKLDQAILAFKKVTAIKPDNADAYYNMGIALKDQGKLEEAIEAYTKALAIKPDYAKAYNNMGITLQEQGKPEEAIEAYKKALDIKPDYADAHNNMGVTLQAQGKLEEAIEAYNKALAIKPDYAEAFYNMGITLQEQGKLEAAIEAYNKALVLKPDYADAHNNMGNTLQDQGKLEEAIEAYNKALTINPDYTEAYNNMGATLQAQGKLEEAIEAYNKALAIKPDNAEAWNNIVFPLQSIKLKVSSQEKLVSYYPKDTGSNYYQIAKSNLNFKINLGGTDAEKSLSESLNALAKADYSVIKKPEDSIDPASSQMELTDKVVALVHWGRSGTGLLHSLIDGHLEVSTLPSIYLSQYFDSSTWERIISDGWSQMADQFMAMYDVIFDAKSRVPVHSRSQILLYNIGRKEGMANVGDQRDEVLSVDKELFHAELQRLMNCYDQLDASIFFKLIHRAYDKAINDIPQKNIIFYHIHNPDTYAQLNFVRSTPKANWVMMVREPVQSCESHLKKPFKKNKYSQIANRIILMLFEIDNIIYHKQNSVGVRLEDLKERPRQTIPALCNWMGIEETESLYEMTAQGKKWWGDPSSPDFEQDGMNPFGKTSINRKLGSVFSSNDQFILRTLFYPFSVRFGYVEANAEQFEIDLQTIRPMLDEMFDFEKTIVVRTQANPEQFMKSGSYLYLRLGLIERWDILKEFGTYPNMIKPLNI